MILYTVQFKLDEEYNLQLLTVLVAHNDTDDNWYRELEARSVYDSGVRLYL